VQVRRTAARVARGADVADHVAALHDVARTERTVPIEVRVVVPLEAGTEHPHDLAAEGVRADARHDAARGAEHGRSCRRKDVDALVLTAARSRVAPRVGEPMRADVFHRDHHMPGRRLGRERVEQHGAVDPRTRIA